MVRLEAGMSNKNCAVMTSSACMRKRFDSAGIMIIIIASIIILQNNCSEICIHGEYGSMDK